MKLILKKNKFDCINLRYVFVCSYRRIESLFDLRTNVMFTEEEVKKFCKFFELDKKTRLAFLALLAFSYISSDKNTEDSLVESIPST